MVFQDVYLATQEEIEWAAKQARCRD